MKFKELFFDQFLGDNPQIVSTLLKHLSSNCKVLVEGPTGSGKTTLVMEILGTLEGVQKYLKDYPDNPKEIKLKMKAMQKRYEELHKIAYHQLQIDDNIKDLKNLSEEEQNEYKFLSEKIKYYSLVNKGELDLKEINKYRFIFLVPTRVLCSQVARKNKTAELKGKMRINESDSIVTATYDNINKAISESKKNILIIDESHKLVSDNNYRGNALNAVREAENKCFSVMHITATTRPLLQFYKYDHMIKMSPLNADKNKNVNTLTLVDIPSQKRAESLISFIQDKFQEDKKMLVRVNSSKIIKEIVNTLSLKNITLSSNTYKIGIACNKETMRKLDLKHLDVTEHIQEKELIPENVNIVLTTSVLDVGASIHNEDLTLVYFAKDSDDLKQDDLKQFFARTRAYNKEAYLLTSNAEGSIVKPIEEVEGEINKNVDQVINGFNSAIEGLKMMLNGNQKALIETIRNMLNTKDLRGNAVNQGCISLNEEDFTLVVSEENKRAKILNTFDAQLYYSINTLKELIKDDLKAENIEICQMYYNKDESKKDEELAQVKKISREEKKEKEKVALEVLADKAQANIIETLIEINTIKSSNKLKLDEFKESIKDKEILQKIEVLEDYKPLQKALKSCNKVNLSVDETINLIYQNGYSDIDYHLLKKQCTDINNNQDLKNWDNKVTQTYLIIRKHTKTAMKNRTSVSKKNQLWIYQELLANKLIKQLNVKKLLDSHPEFQQFYQRNTHIHNPYLEYLIIEYSKHKPQLPNTVIDLFTNEINRILSLVYRLDSESRISSLNK